MDLKRRIERSPTKNYAQIISEYPEELGAETVYIALFTFNLVLTTDLKILPKLLTERKMFPKWDKMRKDLGWCAGVRAFGNYGLFVDPGTDIWATKRRIMDPAFARSFLRTTMDGMNKVVSRLLRELESKSERGQVFDISESLDRAAFESISLCGFNWTDEMIENHGESAMRLARVAVEVMALVFKDPLSFKIPWARLAEKQKFKDAFLPMRDLNGQHLMKIKDEAVSKDNLLSSIIRANGCSDDLSMEDLIDDYNVFLVAGMETTSITMACAVWFLSMNPHVYETAVAE
jgi:cytochrome P450